MIRFELVEAAEHGPAHAAWQRAPPARPSTYARGGARRAARGGLGAAPSSSARDDEHVDLAAAADDLVEQRAAQPVAPARRARLADHDPADVALAREGAAAPRCTLVARERSPSRRPSSSASLKVAARRARSAARERRLRGALDVGHDPLGAEPRGHAPRRAHQAAALGVRPDADQDPLGHRPGGLDLVVAPVVLHVGVDVLGGAAQRQLAQRQQVARAEEAARRRCAACSGR